MAEKKEFESEYAMKKYIVEQWYNMFSIEDIVLSEEIMNDERIGWEDTRYVCTKRLGNEDYIEKYGVPQCIGMCATKFLKG